MKFQKSCFWILICGVYLVCNSAAFGHAMEDPSPATIDGVEYTVTYQNVVHNDVGHSADDATDNPIALCDSLTFDDENIHEHQYDIVYTPPAGSSLDPLYVYGTQSRWGCRTPSTASPNFSPDTATVTSSGAIGVLGTYTATNPGGGTLTYTISGPTYFSVNSSGELRLTKTLSAGTPDQTVIIVAQDGNGGYGSITVTIEILATSTQTVVNNDGVSNQGSNTQTVIPEGAVVRDGVVHLQSVVVNEPVPEDVDGDGDVDNDDLSAIAMKFGSTAADDLERYDVDGDGDIDTDDFAQVQSQFGNAAPAASHTPQEQLRRIVERDNPGAVVRVVMQFPEKRLAEPTPKETVLLANYPNPFNPETWIPYRLAKAADVTLTIYATSGEVVRSLALGHQPAGNYVNRAQAAYWDGKDVFGEPVASGLYFYSLTTDDFSATRKMLVAK